MRVESKSDQLEETVSSKLAHGSMLDGCLLQKCTEHFDLRGSFTEIFQESWGSAVSPVEWSMVKSGANVFRGMYYHRRHDEYFMLVKGHAFVGLKDMRPGSSTYLKSALFELHEGDPSAVIFPVGILHGWYFIKKSIHMQAVSESYEDYNPDDNHACMWNDTKLEIPWPFDNPIISEKGSRFVQFDELPPYRKGF